MPKVTTRRKRIRLPFLVVHVPVGWEVKPLTAAEKKARQKKREDEAKKAKEQVEQHAKAQQRPAKKAAAPKATPPAQSGAQWPYGQQGPAPAKKAAKGKSRSGQLCGQPLKRGGGTCKRVVTNVPCPEHPAGKPRATP